MCMTEVINKFTSDAQPTEAETAVWNQVSAVLEEAHGILAELQSYNGAGQEIREAIQNPNDLQLQEKAWNAVCPLVAKLKRFYEFSLRLENALRSLLEALTSPPYAPMQHLEREQALAKQFAEILHFTLSFDELKMTNPAIQNDFSYYRRTISRNRLNNQQLEAENEVNNEMANRMSLFYAEATPMLKTLSNATTKFVSENKTLPIEDTTDCLSTMACVCRVMLETPEYRCRFTNTDTMLFCMRVMVGVIILYDHVHPVGAFAKTSKIDMKGCIKVLKEQPSNSVEGLLNALSSETVNCVSNAPPTRLICMPAIWRESPPCSVFVPKLLPRGRLRWREIQRAKVQPQCSRPAVTTPISVSRGNPRQPAANWPQRTQATTIENIQPCT
ncbi:Protein FAM49A [Triplophysa tibetana]|uniref:Protein FAM49A n=1 Tax=Triplophysa tibetana TaxID=1572043 RepID=A0A5A9NNK1_9TELE|nr:Protein FAM49A [Triplophysa tibetana]